jgi:phospholipase D1/2
MALNIDSEFTEKYLVGLSSNIKVLRHPNYVFIPFLWSHHEKIVVVDQKVGYLGGLDIGYGRFDNKKHSLSD